MRLMISPPLQTSYGGLKFFVMIKLVSSGVPYACMGHSCGHRRTYHILVTRCKQTSHYWPYSTEHWLCLASSKWSNRKIGNLLIFTISDLDSDLAKNADYRLLSIIVRLVVARLVYIYILEIRGASRPDL